MFTNHLQRSASIQPRMSPKYEYEISIIFVFRRIPYFRPSIPIIFRVEDTWISFTSSNSLAMSETRCSSLTRTWGICTRRAGKLERARSRLYRSQIFHVNMRWKANAEIYRMYFAPFSWDPFSWLNLLFENR